MLDCIFIEELPIVKREHLVEDWVRRFVFIDLQSTFKMERNAFRFFVHSQTAILQLQYRLAHKKLYIARKFVTVDSKHHFSSIGSQLF